MSKSIWRSAARAVLSCADTGELISALNNYRGAIDPDLSERHDVFMVLRAAQIKAELHFRNIRL